MRTIILDKKIYFLKLKLEKFTSSKMQNKRIIIIGDSPATYICGIYLHTANIPVTILRSDMNLDYSCTFVPGVEANKKEYNQKCHDQAKHMGIEVVDGEGVKVTQKDDIFTVSFGSKSIEADIIVSDMSVGLKANDNIFIVDNLILEREAIVIAGTGCMIAFEIKEMVQ